MVNGSLALAAVLVPTATVYLLVGAAYAQVAIVVLVASTLFLAVRLIRAQSFIDNHIARHLGDPAEFTAFSKTFPLYRFVDLHNAARRVHDEVAGRKVIESNHPQASLAEILSRDVIDEHRTVNKAERVARPSGPDDEGFFPRDVFFLAKSASAGGARSFILRVRVLWNQEAMLEVGARGSADAEALLERVQRLASEDSVYRRHVIEPSFETEVRDEYGDVDRGNVVDIRFKKRPDIARDDVVLEPEKWAVIERNVVDFHERRAQLAGLGLPSRRGVLFYGAPGTGKSYMCKHLASRLPDATMVVATGRTLLHIKSLCNIARMLQPAILVLEDVDLVFSERDTNAYGVALGEVMDELDGFGPDDNLIFILTTNAIERVERAIRERPGRISQCIHFGPPSTELRERYLRRQLEPYDTSRLDVPRLAEETDGATQAFLKEFVFRAVQIASDGTESEPGSLTLTDDHFAEALREMNTSTDGAGQAIVGFRSPPSS